MVQLLQGYLGKKTRRNNTYEIHNNIVAWYDNYLVLIIILAVSRTDGSIITAIFDD